MPASPTETSGSNAVIVVAFMIGLAAGAGIAYLWAQSKKKDFNEILITRR